MSILCLTFYVCGIQVILRPVSGPRLQWSKTSVTMRNPIDPLHRRRKEELRLRGASLSQIAADLGLSPSTVTIVSQGYRRSHRVQTEIARRLGTTPEALFPERYPGKKEDDMAQ